MSVINVSDMESHRIETVIPEEIIKAVTLVMSSMQQGARFEDQKLETELKITSKVGTLTLFGMIKEMSCDYNSFDAPYQFGGSPRFGIGSRSSGYDYGSRRVQADVKFGLFTSHALWNEALTADEVLRIKAELWGILNEHVYDGALLEKLIDTAFGKVLSDSRNTKSPNSAQQPKIKEKKKEDAQMFGKHKITEVVISEINPITLELAVKKLAASNSKIEILERKDVVYLVTEGSDPVELNGGEFKSMIEKALIGKTIQEVKANASISQLLASLNVVESITLTKQQVSLTDLLK